MMNKAPMPPPADDSVESDNSITAPVAALGGAAVGDTVAFIVDSIDGDTASLSPVDEGDQSTEDKGSTISQASKLFNGDNQ